MNQRLLLFVFCIVFSLSYLSAQVGFSIPEVSNAQPGMIIDLPFTVQGFDSIVAAQFVVRWDPSVLEFQAVSGLELPELNDSHFGLNQVSEGIIRFVWWSSSVTIGVSVTDNTEIFHIKFKVVGPVNSGTPVYVTELPPTTYFEVLNASSVAFSLSQSQIDNGFVAVGYTPAVSSSELIFNIHISTYPNPFSDGTKVFFNLNSPADMCIKVLDMVGNPVFERNEHFPIGASGMEIASNIFDKKGIYFLIIRSNQFSHIETLLLL